MSYLSISRHPDAVAAAADPASASLTDAKRIWCSEHDMSETWAFGNNDDVVIKAAEDLGIEVPEDVA